MVRAMLTTAALVAVYAVTGPSAPSASIEEMCTIDPAPRAAIVLATACEMRKVPITLMSKV